MSKCLQETLDYIYIPVNTGIKHAAAKDTKGANTMADIRVNDDDDDTAISMAIDPSNDKIK